MYKRLSAVLFPIVTAALIGAGVWGYQENKDKNAVLIKAENQYQRSFHELSYHVNQLNGELGNAVAVNSSSPNFYRKQLVNIWRLTNQAQKEITQLPLAMMPFNKTQEFLHKMSTFSYDASLRDLSAKPLTDGEKKTLNDLYAHSKEIQKQLDTVQSQILSKNLRWMDVETALASQKENTDNVIIDGFRSMDKTVEGYSEVNWGPTIADEKNRNLSGLSGNEISAEEAKQRAALFAGLKDTSILAVTENGRGSGNETYTVTSNQHGSSNEAQLDFSKKGGHFLMYMNHRAVNSANLDLRGARDAAQEFLDRHGYANMTAVGHDSTGNVTSLTFAHRQGDTIIYPQKVVVNVALDNGEIIGVQATEYAFEHQSRQLPKPRLTEAEARKDLQPHFQLYDTDRALIRNDSKQEVLCYQFHGNVNGSVYKIFINADTGEEEKIERLNAQDVQKS